MHGDIENRSITISFQKRVTKLRAALIRGLKGLYILKPPPLKVYFTVIEEDGRAYFKVSNLEFTTQKHVRHQTNCHPKSMTG